MCFIFSCGAVELEVAVWTVVLQFEPLKDALAVEIVVRADRQLHHIPLLIL